MQHWIRTLAVVVVGCHALQPVCAQFSDSTRQLVPALDSVPLRIDWNKPEPNNRFPLEKFIIPAGMISYGVSYFAVNGVKRLNENIKEEVAMEHPHHKVSIDNYLQYAPALAVYGLNAAGIHGKHNFKDRSILYGMSMVISNATVFSIKKFSNVQRPDGSNDLSFPSGHTANAFVAAEFMRQEYKDVSPWYGVAGYAVAATTGYLRMYNNKHWFSDVVAGAGVGIASTKLAYWLYPMLKRTFSKNKDLNTVVMPTYSQGAIGLGLVHKFK